MDTQNRLLAGTEPNGILYRITAKDKAFVLYDANLPEIRAIVPMPDGTVYAAALGGSIAKRAQSASQAAQGSAGSGTAVTSTVTSITVEAQAAEVKPPDPTKPTDPSSRSPPARRRSAPASRRSPRLSGVEKSALYRINPDNTVETLWSSKEENVYDILALEKQILFSTDQDGRIYGLAPDRRVTLVTQTNEGETTRLLPANIRFSPPPAIWAASFASAKAPAPPAPYEAPVHDTATASRWGSLSWRADLPAGTVVQFRTRSGNSANPDRTWSDWSEPLTDLRRQPHHQPQRALHPVEGGMTGAGGPLPAEQRDPGLPAAELTPPVLKSIDIVTAGRSPPCRPRPRPPRAAAYSVTVTDSDSSTSSTQTQTLHRAAAQQITRRLDGRGPRWRSPGLQPLFPRRGRNPVEAAPLQPARQFHDLRCGHIRRRQILLPRACQRP